MCNYYHTNMPQRTAGPPARILLVEDEVDLARLVKLTLMRNGYEVSHAKEAISAYRSFRRRPYDLLLLDLILPGMPGLELLRLIRSESQVPALLMSGRLTAPARALGLKLGAHDYLVKPFAVPALLSAVKSALRQGEKTPTPRS